MAVNRLVIYTYMGLMLLFGTANTIIGKLMDLTEANGKLFIHPYFQTCTMFFGELLCLFIYKGMMIYQNRRQAPSSPPLIENKPSTGLAAKLGKFVFGIPAFFDMCASTLMFLGLVLSASSVYQMVRGFIVVVVALYSVFLLKRKIFKHQIVGVVFVFIGVVLVGVSAVTNGSVIFIQSTASNPLVGIIVLIFAQFLAGGVFASEEKFLANVVVHPMQAVGYEGLCGFGYYVILLLILNFIPCSDPNMCSGGGSVESVPDAFSQLGASPLLVFLLVLFFLSIALFNWTGVTTTKYASALARSTIDTSRTLLVWAISMAIGWEVFDWLQLIGFLILVFGTVLYNEVLVLPFCGLKESVEQHHKYLKEREGLGSEKGDELTDDFVGMSPGAAYDTKKMQRRASELDKDIAL